MNDAKTIIEFLTELEGPTRLVDGALDEFVCLKTGAERTIPSPHYTASVDAAMSLLPVSYTTNVHADEDETFPVVLSLKQFNSGWEAAVSYDTQPRWNIEQRELSNGWSAACAAIAICIAAIEAHKRVMTK